MTPRRFAATVAVACWVIVLTVGAPIARALLGQPEIGSVD